MSALIAKIDRIHRLRRDLQGRLDTEAYDAWFRAKVQQALADPYPPTSHDAVMDEAQAMIDKKRRAHS